VETSSIAFSPSSTRVTARYRLGDSGAQRAGALTTISRVRSAESLGCTVTAPFDSPAAAPAGVNKVVRTITVAVLAEWLAKLARTRTVARPSLTSGVVIDIPHGTTCSAFVISNQTCR